MKKIILGLICIIILSVFGCATSGKNSDSGYRHFSVKEEWLVKKVNVAELEKEINSLNKPSSFSLNEYEWFKSQITEGDEIWYFNTPDQMWRALYGAKGYVLIRGGKQVCTLVLMVS